METATDPSLASIVVTIRSKVLGVWDQVRL